MQKLPGQSKTYRATHNVQGRINHSVMDVNIADADLEHIERVNHGKLPPAYLTLKLGCIVIVTKNLCDSEGLVNGKELCSLAIKVRM